MADEEVINDIDALMDLDPLELGTRELDAIIAYHRKKRAEREALPPGTRGKRTTKASKDTGGSSALSNLVKTMVLNSPAAEKTIVKRRI